MIIQLPDSTRLYLDGMRAIAANLVVFSHALLIFFPDANSYGSGPLGVLVFFFLSVFLIAGSLINRLSKPDSRLSDFLADRAARVLTPYIPALILIALVDLVIIRGHWGQPGTARGFVAFIGNFLLLQDYPFFQAAKVIGFRDIFHLRSYNSAEPFWTIAIEFWIYVFVGVCIYGYFLEGNRVKKLWVAVLLAISAPIVAWNSFAGGGGCLSLVWFMGAACFPLMDAISRARSRISLRPVVVALWLLALGGVGITGRSIQFGFRPYDFQTATFIGMILFGFILIFNATPKSPRAVFGAVPFLASYSYSLYLVHNTVLIVFYETLRESAGILFTALAAVLSSHCVAYVMYRLFERHYRAVAVKFKPALRDVLEPASPANRTPLYPT